MEEEQKIEYSFSASGWLFIYQLGVAYSLMKHNLHVDNSHKKYSCHFVGSSGGSLVSAVLATDVEILPIKEYLLRCVADCKSNPKVNMFKMRKYCEGAFEFAADKYTNNLHTLESGRLNISVTLLPSCENVIISKFQTITELHEAILGSCTMTPLAGFPFALNRPNDPQLHGKWVIDGGISQVQPITSLNGLKRVTCSPFYFWDCDIKPSKYVPIHWGFYPPSVEEMDDLFWLGVADAEKWLRRNLDYLINLPMELCRIPSTVAEPKDEEFFDADAEMKEIEDMFPELTIPSTQNDDMRMRKSFLRFLQQRTMAQGEDLGPNGIYDIAADSFVVFAQKSCIKPLAVSAVYAELSSKALLNAARALITSVEQRRRQNLPASRHLFSIRRWLPETILGSTSDSVNNVMDCVHTLVNPFQLWHQVEQKPKLPSNESIEVHTCKLTKHSYVYKALHASAIL